MQPSTARRRLIDVSHTVEHGMITYKGLPAPVICDWLSREASRANYTPGTEFQIGKIEMIANTGTYVDSPFHRYDNGKDLSSCRWSSWPISSALSSAGNPVRSRAIGPQVFERRGSGAGRSSSTQAGRPTGGRTPTSRGIRT